MSGWVLAIDFGTTSTAVAMAVDGRVELVEIDGAPRMPSMVFWRDGTGGHTGRLVLGEEADTQSSRAPWALERTPKRRIGDEYLLLGDQQVRVTDAIGAILRKAAEEAISRRGGEAPSVVRLTHPARWGSREPGQAAPGGAQRRLRRPRVRARAGRGGAALRQRAASGRSSTSPCTTSAAEPSTPPCCAARRTPSRWSALRAVTRTSGARTSTTACIATSGKQLDEEQWTQLRESRERQWSQSNRLLLHEARRAKEILSKSPDYEVYVPPPVDRDLHVTADELQRPHLRAISRARSPSSSAPSAARASARAT